jgi:hypothetical protein
MADWTDEFFDPFNEGGSETASAGTSISEFDRVLKVREQRAASTKRGLDLLESRDAVNAADKEAKRILAAMRLATQQKNYEATGEERVARREASRERDLAGRAERERRAEYRQRRDAERQAYRQSRDEERDARRDAAGQTQQKFSAPSFSRPGRGVVPSGGGWEPDRAAVAKFIIFATALGALGAVANDIVNKAPAAKLADGTKVPQHLRSFGGALIAGVIALVVNEVYPAGGAVMGAGIVGLVVIPNWTPLIPKIGDVLGGLAAQPKAKIFEGFPKGTKIADLPNGAKLITPGDGGRPYQLVPVGGGNYSTEPYGLQPGQVVR